MGTKNPKQTNKFMPRVGQYSAFKSSINLEIL